MRRASILMTLFVLEIACRPSHLFHNINLPIQYYQDLGLDVRVNLNDYTAYYRITYRHTDSLEKVYKNTLNEVAGGSVHVTDLQYILINSNTGRFLHLSYIPTRLVSFGKNPGYYLDKTNSYYNRIINIYNLNMLQYGVLSDGTFLYRFKEANQNRNMAFSFTGDGLTIETMVYPDKKKDNGPMQLADHFLPSYQDYIRMDSFALQTETINGSIRSVRKEIVFSHFKKRWQGNGKFKKNMILFTYGQPGLYTNFYFHQRGDRFNFVVPPNWTWENH